MNYVTATVYAQVRAKRYYSGGTVSGAVVERATGSKPKKLIGGTQLVKLTLRLPAAIFEPLTPEAVITIPENLIVGTPVEVRAVDPR